MWYKNDTDDGLNDIPFDIIPRFKQDSIIDYRAFAEKAASVLISKAKTQVDRVAVASFFSCSKPN